MSGERILQGLREAIEYAKGDGLVALKRVAGKAAVYAMLPRAPDTDRRKAIETARIIGYGAGLEAAASWCAANGFNDAADGLRTLPVPKGEPDQVPYLEAVFNEGRAAGYAAGIADAAEVAEKWERQPVGIRSFRDPDDDGWLDIELIFEEGRAEHLIAAAIRARCQGHGSKP